MTLKNMIALPCLTTTYAVTHTIQNENESPNVQNLVKFFNEMPKKNYRERATDKILFPRVQDNYFVAQTPAEIKRSEDEHFDEEVKHGNRGLDKVFQEISTNDEDAVHRQGWSQDEDSQIFYDADSQIYYDAQDDVNVKHPALLNY